MLFDRKTPKVKSDLTLVVGGAGSPKGSHDFVMPGHEKIAQRAYEIFVARGGQHGSATDDWFEAERVLRSGPPHALDEHQLKFIGR
jgi:hypothetical protein